MVEVRVSTKVELLQVEPTTRCNYTCGFCCGRSMVQGDLTYEAFERLLERVPDVRTLQLQGEGEPLLNRRFPDMLALAVQRGVRVTFITNGSQFSDEMVQAILDWPPEKIIISIESADAASFQRIRGGKLEKVEQGIARLLTERRRRGLSKPAVGFAVMVMRQTIGHLAAILELYRSLAMDGGIGVQTLQTMPGYVQAYRPELLGQTFAAADAGEVLERVWSEPELLRIQEESVPDRSFFHELTENTTNDSGPCPWLERALYVTQDAKVGPCCYVKDVERYGFGPLTGDWDELFARRADMQAKLASGDTPACCQGCMFAGKGEIKRAPRRLALVDSGGRV